MKVVLVFLWGILGMCDGKMLYLQASKAKGEHSVNRRSNSVSGRTVLIDKGESITLTFCLRTEQTQVSVSGILFSNDGKSETCDVVIDRKYVIGKFSSIAESNGGHLWNQFRNSGPIGKSVSLPKGIHSIRVECQTEDGVEIDIIKLEVSDKLLTNDTFECKLQCQSVSALQRAVKPNRFARNATVSQRSYPTKCAEEDNVHMPLYMNNIANYTITASLPTYRTFSNRRGKDEANCVFLPPLYWSFKDFKLSSKTVTNKKVRQKNAEMTFWGGVKSKINSAGLLVNFRLEGPSKGHLNSIIGSTLALRIRPLPFALLAEMTFSGERVNKATSKKYLLAGQRELVWEFPDFSWSERRWNTVSMIVYSIYPADIYVEELRMDRRPMKPEVPLQIYKSDEIIIEGMDIEFSWREPEKMSLRRMDTGEKWEDVDYFRIYRPVPWADGYAQVFVLYQDGNVRLLRLPPPGLDWIPFGSSVIVGQTDPRSFRPVSPISQVDISPEDMSMVLYYQDGGSARLDLQDGPHETTLTVSNIQYKNTAFLPFATFRSMYVAEGNSDCDRVMVDDADVYHIMDKWRATLGRSFTFFRQCESKHLTLSPDIRLEITGTYDD